MIEERAFPHLGRWIFPAYAEKIHPKNPMVDLLIPGSAEFTMR